MRQTADKVKKVGSLVIRENPRLSFSMNGSPTVHLLNQESLDEMKGNILKNIVGKWDTFKLKTPCNIFYDSIDRSNLSKDMNEDSKRYSSLIIMAWLATLSKNNPFLESLVQRFPSEINENTSGKYSMLLKIALTQLLAYLKVFRPDLYTNMQMEWPLNLERTITLSADFVDHHYVAMGIDPTLKSIELFSHQVCESYPAPLVTTLSPDSPSSCVVLASGKCNPYLFNTYFSNFVNCKIMAKKFGKDNSFILAYTRLNEDQFKNIGKDIGELIRDLHKNK